MKEFGSRYSRGFGSNNRMSFTGAREEMERREKNRVREEKRIANAAERSQKEQERERKRVNREYEKERKAGEAFNKQKREQELEAMVKDRFDAMWKDNETKFKSESGRAIIEVKNSLQMDIRNISVSLDRLAKKYSKKTGNQHINEGVRKLKDKIQPILEEAVVQLLRYMIQEEHKQNEELMPMVVMAIAKAEYDIGTELKTADVKRVIQETITGIIQGRISKTNLDNYVYSRVEMYSRRVDYTVQHIE